MFYYLDFLVNITLNKHYSRDVFERGFVVDKKSGSGSSVRDKSK